MINYEDIHEFEMMNEQDESFEAMEDKYYNDQTGWSQEGLSKIRLEFNAVDAPENQDEGIDFDPMCDGTGMYEERITVTCDGCDQELYIDQDDPVCVCSCGCVMSNPEYDEEDNV